MLILRYGVQYRLKERLLLTIFFPMMCKFVTKQGHHWKDWLVVNEDKKITVFIANQSGVWVGELTE